MERTAYLSYSITSTPKVGYNEVTLSGRFYVHDHGYVQLSTEQPLQITFQHPESGVIKISESNSWAELEFTGNGRYRIDCSDGTIIQGVLNLPSAKTRRKGRRESRLFFFHQLCSFMEMRRYQASKKGEKSF
jgi:hypothetical protein